MKLIGIGALDPKNQPWNTPDYQECVGKKIQACGVAHQGAAPAVVQGCIDSAQSSCIAESAARARLRWMLIGVGFGTVAVALIWRHKRRGA